MNSNSKEQPPIIEGEFVGTQDTNSNDKSNSHEKNIAVRRRYVLSDPSIVTKSNDLIQKTRYALPRVQQKILLAMIAQIDPKKDTDPSKVYTMSFSDFAKLTGVNVANRAYRIYLKNTIQELADSSFWIDAKSVHGEEDRLIRWIGDETKINYKTQTIHLQFSKNIFPYLTQLKSNYTSFNVEYLLHMKSTYSMRFYEIMLSYDNGETDYGYNNGLVFQPVTEEMLDKFKDKANDIRGFMYKVFDIQELKEQLSPAPERDRNGKSTAPREKPLTEKYANFTDFERNVLRVAKDEINAMTDLWFDYIPVRIKGFRSYKRVYIFIKYKTNEEMKIVNQNYAGRDQDFEVPRKGHKNQAPVATEKNEDKKDNVKDIHVTSEKLEQGKQADFGGMQDDEVPRRGHQNYADDEQDLNVKVDGLTQDGNISRDAFSLSVTRAMRMLEALANYSTLKESVGDELAATIESVCIYTARLLTNRNPRKYQIAHDTRDALNRVIASNGDLSAWSVGMALMMDEKKEAGLLKTPQYNSMIVFNAIEDLKVISDGKRKLESLKKRDSFSQKWMNAFDE